MIPFTERHWAVGEYFVYVLHADNTVKQQNGDPRHTDTEMTSSRRWMGPQKGEPKICVGWLQPPDYTLMAHHKSTEAQLLEQSKLNHFLSTRTWLTKT